MSNSPTQAAPWQLLPPKYLIDLGKAVFCLDSIEDFGIAVLLSPAAGPLPFGEKGSDREVEFPVGQLVDPLKGPPVREDHQGQGGKGDVGAGEQGGQPAERKKERLSDEDQDVLGPLLVQNRGTPQPGALRRPQAGVADRDGAGPA